MVANVDWICSNDEKVYSASRYKLVRISPGLKMF